MVRLSSYIPSMIWYFLVTFLLNGTPAHAEPVQTLQFDAAFEEIIDNACEIKAAQEEYSARKAQRRQAQALPNPDLTVNLDTIGKLVEGNENQLFVGVTQVVELGGKRSARVRVANADICSASWDLEIMKCDIFQELLHRFVEVAAAQERVNLMLKQYELSLQMLGCMQAKTDSGKISPLHLKKAEVTCKTSKLLTNKRKSELVQAKRQLSGLWDCDPPQFDAVAFNLYQITPPPSLESLIENLSSNPVFDKAEADIEKTFEIYELERTLKIPDIAFQVGVTTQRFTKEPALTVGFDIPIPIFNQNRGNISRASHEYAQAIFTQCNLTAHLKADLTVLYEAWTLAFEQARDLKDEIMPHAVESYQFAELSYQEGKYAYLDLLDARSTLFEIQEQFLDAVEEYHHKRADVLRLIGQCSINCLQ